jgi:predicted  nucleic acid-binding Zn-ribbon protein
MSFNLEKYLIENNLTIISRIREEEDMEIEPSKDDLKQSEKDFRNLDKDKEELEDLKSQIKKAIYKFSDKDDDGKIKRGPNGELKITDMAAYKKAVGQIPYKIQALQAKIKKVENPKLNSDEEDN